MQLKEKIDLVMKLIDKIDTTWNVFFVVNIGVFGAFASIKVDSLPSQKMSALVFIYFYFSAWNALVLLRAYKFLTLCIEEVKLSVSSDSFNNEILVKTFEVLNYKNRTWFIAFSHVCIPMLLIIIRLV